jgi:hypothetical protein
MYICTQLNLGEIVADQILVLHNYILRIELSSFCKEIPGLFTEFGLYIFEF